MSNLAIFNTSIRTLDGLYSLNDCHKASGEQPKHRPSLFIRNEQTKELISEINGENDLSTNSILAHKSLKGGLNAGTWACEELVLSYAMWISPKFHLTVLRAFIAMHKGEAKPQQIALPKPKVERLVTLQIPESTAKALLDTWLGFTRLTESTQILLNSLKGFESRHLDRTQFNLHYSDKMIKETLPLMQTLMQGYNEALIPKRLTQPTLDF